MFSSAISWMKTMNAAGGIWVAAAAEAVRSRIRSAFWAGVAWCIWTVMTGMGSLLALQDRVRYTNNSALTNTEARPINHRRLHFGV